ncbi:MAG TPA: glycerol-3-phosphate dehydrogenase/oxidase [Chryseolinea sp.]|nr:glycerol-3-phosphate dehydrogenase/oxidase [Chryseolinea sp.]HPM29440.1 glycerol-3-phosphate dehydrogenase/oxidase [Chryseolinea sp.]
MTDFSFNNREKIKTELSYPQFDLIIIGGGITGAGIALDAASRGLKTALVEKNDFAFGTSSRSTKLIHGGLRYLKQFEFGLVKEVGSERAILHKLAPHLVVPEKMLLPLYEKKGMGYWLTSIGLKVYDILAGVKKEDQRRMLTKLYTLKYEPLLQHDVKGGAIYAEYRTDDARLTIEIMKTAVQHGATVLNYASVKEFVYSDSKISGVAVEDQLSHETFSVNGKVVVSATGPWVDELRELNKSKQGKRLHLTKGVHIVFPREKLPVAQAIYFDVEDGRMIFAIPRGRTTYVGTTDTNYQGSKDNVVTTYEDAHYLVKAVNAMFPSVNVKMEDIESSWAGLRPLIHEEGKSASELSRKDEIFESSTGLISIAGGKLTGYRKMAERVVDLVIEEHFEARDFKSCFTEKIKFEASKFANVKEVKQYTNTVFQKLKLSGFSELTSRYLVENFGVQTDLILKQYDLRSAHEHPELSLLKAELWFCIQYEMVTGLQDFFMRRIGIVNFDIHRVITWKHEIANECKSLLNWSDDKMIAELKSLEELIFSVQNFKDIA